MSRGALIGGVIGALVLGLIAGGLIGWQVEKKRVEDDVAKAKTVARASGARDVRPVGVVTSVSPTSVTIRYRSSRGSRTFAVTGATRIERSVAGSAGNVAKGSIVLVQPQYGSGTPSAAEIVVLPPSTRVDKP